ncbi:RNA polymerase sigma factor [Paenibacillus beijingensis]|uniref:RNA polymerase n=1 Tax=Paenibacillus beijingensis TaxID=1126833 RepID=A0A0D5NPA4_9BACL|nr:sigma-70 family RNA polymerase sigma factor [Paenibacillus beijingensis]AJY77005.1 RNA polymerase [Paenibacillus beijingensis]
MRNLSDYELMQLVKNRKQKALSVLYDRYGALVYSFAMKALRDETAAREIVQAVFLRLWTTGSGYDPEKGKFTSWLLTVTRNLTTDYIRQQRRESLGRIQIDRERLNALPDQHAESPEEHIVRHSLREQIRHACKHLSKPQQTLLEHFYWHGYSLNELALMYDQPLGTVKNRLHQTLKILRRHLASEGDS